MKMEGRSSSSSLQMIEYNIRMVQQGRLLEMNSILLNDLRSDSERLGTVLGNTSQQTDGFKAMDVYLFYQWVSFLF